jgi:UDP-sulfoquinovose synthase
VESEDHYYNAKHTKLLELGLRPHHLSAELIDTMLLRIAEQRDRIDPAILVQNVRWVPERQDPMAARS